MSVPILTGPTNVTSVHDRLIDTVHRTIAATLRTAALGERVTYEAALQLANGPQGQPVPIVALYLQIPSPLLGQCLFDLAMLEAAQATEPAITQAVTDAVGRLFTARSQASSLTATG